jgi:hypothetical protein
MTQIETSSRRRPDGPNAGILGIVSLVLTVASVAIPPLFAAGMFFPSPLGSSASVNAYLSGHRDAVTATGFLVFAASVPLGIYTATTYARLLKLGVRVPGPNIALFGGIAASILLSISGLLTWAIGQPVAGQSPALLSTLDYFIYALGGAGFVGGLGLLVAGVAVPSLILRLTLGWVAWVGLILAGLSELSFLALVLPQLTFLLPIGRFGGLIWLLAVGFLLPRNRHEVSARDEK